MFSSLSSAGGRGYQTKAKNGGYHLLAMMIKLLVTIGLLAAASLAIIILGFGIPSAFLSASSLVVLWWWFIRETAEKEKSPDLPVCCCHYLGDFTEEKKEHR
jgi:hypothetical protein